MSATCPTCGGAAVMLLTSIACDACDRIDAGLSSMSWAEVTLDPAFVVEQWHLPPTARPTVGYHEHAVLHVLWPSYNGIAHLDDDAPETD